MVVVVEWAFFHGTEPLTLPAPGTGLRVHFGVLFCATVSSRRDELRHRLARLCGCEQAHRGVASSVGAAVRDCEHSHRGVASSVWAMNKKRCILENLKR